MCRFQDDPADVYNHNMMRCQDCLIIRVMHRYLPGTGRQHTEKRVLELFSLDLGLAYGYRYHIARQYILRQLLLSPSGCVVDLVVTYCIVFVPSKLAFSIVESLSLSLHPLTRCSRPQPRTT